jgi:hypothetical protein
MLRLFEKESFEVEGTVDDEEEEEVEEDDPITFSLTSSLSL